MIALRARGPAVVIAAEDAVIIGIAALLESAAPEALLRGGANFPVTAAFAADSTGFGAAAKA
jgi:hypothetical protein